DARHLYAIPSYSALALNTALALLLLAAGMLCARPATGATRHLLHPGAGGHMIRRVLPAAIAIPILLGELRVIGLYQGWAHARIRLALLTLGNVTALGIIIFRNARSLNQLDDQRLIIEAKLRAANEVLETRVLERTEALQGEVRERRRAEEQSRHLLEASPDAILILDGFGSIVRINSRSETLFGHTRAEMVGTPVRRWLVDYRVPDGPAPLELTARAAGNRTLPVSMASSRIVHEDQLLIFLNLRDISEQKRAEALSLSRERRFRAVADTANDAVVSANEAGQLIYVNPAAMRIFGYECDEMLRLTLTQLMPVRYRERHLAGMRRYVETGEGPLIGRSVELYGLRRGDIEFPLDLSLAAWVEDGAWYFTGIIRDISRRRQADERIANLNEALRRRAAELEALNHELEAFSYSVSHDLRAPLRSIDGFSQAVLEDYGNRLDEQGRDHLKRVRSAAQRMGELIDDLLQLARVTRAELSLRPVDLTALAKDVGAEIAQQHPEQSVEFDVRPGLSVEGDPALLRVALENLIDNAWKFTRGRRPARVEVGPLEGGFFVLDNGVGFEPTYADRLFRPFSRLHDARAFPGTGIGLATVQRVIHKHGGTIEAVSRPDHGAVFYVRLRPAAPRAAYTGAS
ncbi:MAG TPA: PAS domain S-box protein, partial [Acidiferrobacteraceae bacterium]|nr:PAS domain S-box protein [Acidiferrobacteraceae bacterium]